MTINFDPAYVVASQIAVRHVDETLKLAGKISDKAADYAQLHCLYDEAIGKKYVSVKWDVSRAVLEGLMNRILKLGAIGKEVDLDNFMDGSYREEALNSTKLP